MEPRSTDGSGLLLVIEVATLRDAWRGLMVTGDVLLRISGGDETSTSLAGLRLLVQMPRSER